MSVLSLHFKCDHQDSNNDHQTKHRKHSAPHDTPSRVEEEQISVLVIQHPVIVKFIIVIEIKHRYIRNLICIYHH